ncbi:ThuA domain-containing protein [Promicromonospora citrea]|uniref:Glycosyl hydrolase n=1 Tax=Promicromonospora citrea TaxID=43677 RepID=A0A8H9L661_9MICO|nr:ThuA domain-containing protein [Promicromonospora citrea]NNH52033.1 ThuA domain-containing protein [Promicromonospora citrea]GGM34185.1 glycosyl hydrolase [Promicromonospora citrea]
MSPRSSLRTSLTGAGQVVLGLAILAALLAGLDLAPATPPSAGSADPRPGPHTDPYTDGVADYGVCRGTDPSCYNDWDLPREDDGRVRVLVLTATGSSRHAHLGPLLPPGMNPPLTEEHVAQNAVVRWGREHGFEVDWTEDVRELDSPGRLAPYDAVVFLSTSRTMLDDAAQTSLLQYVRSGGGFVAIHNTLGAMYHWPWFQGLLGGTHFYDHGPHRDGQVVTTDRRDTSTRELPRRWDFRDEWYHLEPFPTRVRFLAEVDTRTIGSGPGFNGHPGHPGEHPVSWCQYYDGGRAWVTSLGHDPEAWSEDSALPGADAFERHVVGGILGAAGERPFCR